MGRIRLKSPSELDKMRRAGSLTAKVHQIVAREIRAGITTGELDAIAARVMKEGGGRSAFLGYRGFPKNVCASVNEQIVHGIPGERVLQEGEILSLDIGVVLDGYYGDMAVTYPVGRISEEAEALLRVTRGALEVGIAAARIGNRLSDLARAIQKHVESRGYSVVREYVGHGIGKSMHEPPQVPNYWEPGNTSNPRFQEGMVLAIEPMVNAGTFETRQLKDKWTVITKDRKLSAHFEHTVAILADGPEILTVCNGC